MLKTDEHIMEICRTRGNITFLNNSTELYNGYRFIGSTQLTQIYEPRFLVNDFAQRNDMSVRQYNDMHQKSRLFLKKSIDNAALNNEKCVVITHHLPLHELIDEKYNEPVMSKYKQCFSSDMKDVFQNNSPIIKSWLAF
jgi:Icc-related predicted phosphoesterase